MFYAALMLCLLVAGWFLLPHGLRRLSERRLAQLCRTRRAIVLSYDDGPGQGLTPRLLDILRDKGVPATFFILGRNAEVNSALVPSLAEEGHELGSHTFHHGNAWKIPPWRAARDLAAGIRTVRGMGGAAKVFRPPYGKATLATLLQGWWRGQRFGWWTVDSKDTRPPERRRSVEEILAEIDRQGGGVVLMHDFDKEGTSDEATSHAAYVLDLTARIVAFAGEKEYRLMRLSDLYQAEGKPVE